MRNISPIKSSVYFILNFYPNNAGFDTSESIFGIVAEALKRTDW